jgi:hypothetical protein
MMKNLIVMAMIVSLGIGVSITSNAQCCGAKKAVKAANTVTVCTGCGEIKGSGKCCKKNIAKCSKCNLHKGSIGCCKHLKAAKGEKAVKLCAKCGEQKGTEKCCKKDAKKCGCGMIKGSPACCKLPKKK